jgi:hypothetical protein
MKKMTILFCGCILMQMAYSQNLVIDNNITLKRGIYKTYEEFKNNSPSVPMEYEIKAVRLIMENLLYNDTVYQMNIDKDKANEIGDVWGFCDEKFVYINMQHKVMTTKKVFKPGSQFDKLLYVGRYCCFISVQPQSNSINLEHYFVALDFNTGKEIVINKGALKKIISKDEGLLEDFKNEKFLDKNSDDTYIKYLRLYSERHKDEISRN